MQINFNSSDFSFFLQFSHFKLSSQKPFCLSEYSSDYIRFF